MGESMLLASTIVLVATFTSVIFVLLVQRRGSRLLSARQDEWENAREHSLQMWNVQQEKRLIEIERSLTTSVQRVETAWTTWEAHDASLIASIAQQARTRLLYTTLEQEIARIPSIDEVPLEILD